MLKGGIKPGVAVHAHNPSSLGTEEGGLWTKGQPGVYSKVLTREGVIHDELELF